MYTYYEIVKTVFLDEIISNEGKTSDSHKIEIYKKQDGEYYSRILSLECFDLIVNSQPIVASKNMYYLDHILPITEEVAFSSIDDCLNFALKKLEEVYSGKKSMKEINQID